MLTRTIPAAVPCGIDEAPNAKTANPIAITISPKPNLYAGLGLYLLSHNLEKNEAKAMIKKELRILNHETVIDRKSTRLNSSHVRISYAVFCLKKKNQQIIH